MQKQKKQAKKETKENVNILRLNINLEGFKLELVSDEPLKILHELNKLVNIKKELVESVLANAPMDYVDYDEELGFEFEARKLSFELKNQKESMEKLRNLFLKHGKFLYRKESIDLKQEVDFNNKKFSIILDKNDLSMLIKKSFFGIKSGKIKHVFLHIISDSFTKEHEALLLEEMKKRIGLTDVTLIHTPKKIDGAIVSEALIFGDFSQMQEE